MKLRNPHSYQRRKERPHVRTTETFEDAYTYVASIAIVGGWNNLLIEGNTFINPYGWNDTSPPSSPPPAGPAFSYGSGAAYSYSPPGGAMFINNVIIGAGSPPILGIAPNSSYALPTMRGNLGLNPKGNIPAPSFPPTGTGVYNLTGYDVTVYIGPGADGAYISEIQIGPTLAMTGLGLSVDPSYLTVRLLAGQEIVVTYSGGTPTWTWFAE